MRVLGFRSRQEKDPLRSFKEDCGAIASAMKADKLGETVTAVQRLILQYYGDVRAQADASFRSAQWVAGFGFVVLLITIVCVIVMDWKSPTRSLGRGSLGVGLIGLIGSSVAEFIAAVQFVLYGRATRQFGAFHICLERTHRYLLAYTMAEKIGTNRDVALEKIVCIMANAPMITSEDIEGPDLSSRALRRKVKDRHRAALSRT
jgi:hypothetical protein